MNNELVNNLISGLAGSVIGLVATPVAQKFKRANELQTMRGIILIYLMNLNKFLPVLRDDYKLLQQAIKDPEIKKSFWNTSHLQPDVLMSFSYIDLREMCIALEVFNSLIQIRYKIEFLLANTPFIKAQNHSQELIQSFRVLHSIAKSNPNVSDKEFNQSNEEVKLIKQAALDREIDNLLISVDDLQSRIGQLLKDLSGDDWNWTMKYLGN